MAKNETKGAEMNKTGPEMNNPPKKKRGRPKKNVERVEVEYVVTRCPRETCRTKLDVTRTERIGNVTLRLLKCPKCKLLCESSTEEGEENPKYAEIMRRH